MDVNKEIHATARKLHIRVSRSGDSWFQKSTITGSSEQTLLWLQRCAVRRGVLPTTVLPDDDPTRLFTECNGIDPNQEIR